MNAGELTLLLALVFIVCFCIGCMAGLVVGLVSWRLR